MPTLANAAFRSYVERKVRSTIRKYGLIRKDDRLLVAVSGGKDSTSLLYILAESGFTFEAMNADPGIAPYTEINLKNLRKTCSSLKVPLHIFSFKEAFGGSLPDLKKKVAKKGLHYSSCMLCGILKRYLLNKKGRELGFSTIATGHNLDDEAQGFLMNVFRNDINRALRAGPISGSASDARFVRRVKPLYFITEEETRRYALLRKFPVNLEICPHSGDAYRRKFINMLDGFEADHPNVKYNIVRFHETVKALSPGKREEHIGTCTMCGEPANARLCKTCQVLGTLG